MTLLLGYALALAIGISLGLLGGGGSLLTVPIFVYVMGYTAKAGIAMSLPVVGVTSLVAAARHRRAGNVDFRSAFAFGSVAMIGAAASARVSERVPGQLQLAILGVVVVGAAIMMLRHAPAGDVGRPRSPLLVALVGLGVGALTGLVGVGGGFLFVPALAVLGGLPMRRAVGTSLVVIAMNTFAAAAMYTGQVDFDWTVLAIFTALAIAGSLVGARLVERVDQGALRRWFAYFLFAMAAFLLYQNRSVLS